MMPSAVAQRPAFATIPALSTAAPRRCPTPWRSVRSLRENSHRCKEASRKSARVRSHLFAVQEVELAEVGDAVREAEKVLVRSRTHGAA